MFYCYQPISYFTVNLDEKSNGSPYVKVGFTLDISNYNHGKFNGRLSLVRQVRDEVGQTAKLEYNTDFSENSPTYTLGRHSR